MSYWWDGGGGGGWGGWDGGYIDASGMRWGDSLFQPIDPASLPGFGTNWGSFTEYYEAQYDSMVQSTNAVNNINSMIANGQIEASAVPWIQSFINSQNDGNVLADLNRFLNSLPAGAHYIGGATWGVSLPDAPDGTIRSESITFNVNHSFAAYWNESAGGWFIGDQFISANINADGAPDINSDPNYALNIAAAELVDFGARGIQMDLVRQQYLDSIQGMSDEIMQLVRSGQISPEEGARRANELRNIILEASRGQDSELGRAIAESLKREGPTLEILCEKYAGQLFGTAYHNLTGPQQDQVFLEIVRAAGRDRGQITQLTPLLGTAGKALLIAGLAISVYNIVTADDKLDAFGHEGAGLAGGWLGGAAGGAAAGLICGPGAPICSGIGIFVGGIIGAYGGSSLWDWFNSPSPEPPPPPPDPEPTPDPGGGGGGYYDYGYY